MAESPQAFNASDKVYKARVALLHLAVGPTGRDLKVGGLVAVEDAYGAAAQTAAEESHFARPVLVGRMPQVAGPATVAAWKPVDVSPNRMKLAKKIIRPHS